MKSLKHANEETMGIHPILIASKTESPKVSPFSAKEGYTNNRAASYSDFILV